MRMSDETTVDITIAKKVKNSSNCLKQSKAADEVCTLLALLLDEIRALSEIGQNADSQQLVCMVNGIYSLIEESTQTMPNKKCYEVNLKTIIKSAIDLGEPAWPTLDIAIELVPLLG